MKPQELQGLPSLIRTTLTPFFYILNFGGRFHLNKISETEKKSVKMTALNDCKDDFQTIKLKERKEGR